MRVSKNYYFCGLIFVIFGLFFSNCSVKDAKKGKLNQNVLASEMKHNVPDPMCMRFLFMYTQ